VADGIVRAVRTGSSAGFLTPVVRMQRAIPNHRWSPFLRNHDQPRTMNEFGGDGAKARLAAALLFAMPGMPYVYYGEELGMTADKPDPRLRTPMHWTRTKAAGFTTGMPWIPLQPDSMTANVAAQTGDPASLLSLYRTLIRLRASHPALGAGGLLPLTASHDAVVAFVRRLGERAVLVVANLGDVPLSGVRLTGEAGTLAARRHTLTDMLGTSAPSRLTAGRDGSVRAYVPLPVLAPRQAYYFDVSAPR
jgi:glycosidase